MDRIGELAPDSVPSDPILASVRLDGAVFIADVAAGARSRELRAGSCDVLTSAVALVVATTMLRPPDAASSVSTSVPRPAPASASDIEPASEARGEGEHPSRSEESVGATASTVGGAVFGPPEVFPHAMVSIGMRTGGFELDVAWMRGSSLDTSTEAMGALLRIGWLFACRPVELAFHVVGGVGSLWAGGANDRSGAMWGTVGTGLELRVWFDELVGLSVTGDLLIPVSRFATALLGSPPAYELPAITGLIAGGVVVELR